MLLLLLCSLLLLQPVRGQQGLERTRKEADSIAPEVILTDEMRTYLDLSTFDLIKNQIVADIAPFVAVFRASVKAVRPLAAQVSRRARVLAQGFCGDMLKSLGRALIYSGHKVLSVSDSLRGDGDTRASGERSSSGSSGRRFDGNAAHPEDDLDDALPAAVEAELLKVLYQSTGRGGAGEDEDVIEL